MRRSIALTLAPVALVLVAAPASADEVTLRIAYDEAELTTDAGYAALTERVSEAADEACESKDFLLSFRTAPRCKDTLVRKARAELESRRADALGQ